MKAHGPQGRALFTVGKPLINMRFFSPAKVNLTLNVGRLRSDGFHTLDSIFHLIDFGDIVSVEPAQETTVTVEPSLDLAQEDNLAYKAVTLFEEEFKSKTPVAIKIEKQIPAGGGLGGGSSNAATVLYALATMQGIDPQSPHMRAVASRLGSDVPVFLAPTGASLMTGRGERLARSLPPVAGVPVVIALPQDVSVSTAQVYRAFDANPQPAHSSEHLVSLLDQIIPLIPSGATFENHEERNAHVATLIAGEVYNNLASAAVYTQPEVGDCLLFLRMHKATLCAEVSGSGGCSFALCATQEDADCLAQDARREGFFAIKTTLRSRGVTPIHEVSVLNAR